MTTKTLNGYVLGKVRDDAMSIYVNSQNELQVHLQLLSNAPKSYKNEGHLCAFSNLLNPIGLTDSFYLTDEERVQNAYDFFEEQVLIFEIAPNGQHFNVDNIDMRSEKPQMADQYVSIPLYQEAQHGSLAEIVAKLSVNSRIGTNEYVSTDADDYPSHILYKAAAGDVWALGLLDMQEHQQAGFRYRLKNNELRMTKLSQQTVLDMFLYEGVAFEPAETEVIIQDLLLQEQPLSEEDVENLAAQIAMEEKVPAVKAVQHVVQNSASEEQFMQHFIALTEQQNLQYALRDLYHFHTAMKAGGLIILGGMSGTGKSRLVTAYAQALGIMDSQYSFIPVSPAWLDEQDLLGYADIASGQYVPAANSVVTLLKEAADNPNKTYIVCFDEMNLAKIEHYFAQFLSVLELDANDPNRAIRLYNEQLTNSINNRAQYPAKIALGRNIIFVGTVNFDESTHRLSNKVLDRATMIQLSQQDFMSMHFGSERVEQAKDVQYSLTDWATYTETKGLEDYELSLLWDVHHEMHRQSESLGFGPRTVKQINQYMLQYSPVIAAQMTRGEALDEQFISRILPKLRGDESLLTPLVGKYEHEQVVDSKLIALLDVYAFLSDFKKTRAKIEAKAKELTRYGYCL